MPFPWYEQLLNLLEYGLIYMLVAFHKNFIGIVLSHDYDLGAQSSFIRELLELVWWLDYNYYMVITIENYPYLV